MTKTTPEQNKVLVLEAFNTLFNKRDYDGRQVLVEPTSNTAHISSRVVMDCSISSRASRRR